MTDVLHHLPPPPFNTLPSQTPAACYWKKLWVELNTMRQATEFCDVQFTTSDGKILTAHSLILAASSSLFRRCFMKNNFSGIHVVESKLNLDLPNVHSNVLEVVLNFIYGLKPSSHEEILNLFVGSKILEVDEAYNYCLHHVNFDKELVNLLKMKFDLHIVSLVLQDVGYADDTFSNSEHSCSVYEDAPFVIEEVNSIKDTPVNFSEAHSNKIIGKNGFELENGLKSDNESDKLDVHPSQNNYHNDYNKLVELSFTDLTLNSDCPHLKNMKNFNNSFSNDVCHDASFTKNGSEKDSNFSEKHSVNSFIIKDIKESQENNTSSHFLQNINFSSTTDSNNCSVKTDEHVGSSNNTTEEQTYLKTCNGNTLNSDISPILQSSLNILDDHGSNPHSIFRNLLSINELSCTHGCNQVDECVGRDVHHASSIINLPAQKNCDNDFNNSLFYSQYTSNCGNVEIMTEVNNLNENFVLSSDTSIIDGNSSVSFDWTSNAKHINSDDNLFYDINCDDTFNDINYNSNSWSNFVDSDNFDSCANNFDEDSKIVEDAFSSDVSTETKNDNDSLIRNENFPLATHSSLCVPLRTSNDAKQTQSKPAKRQPTFVCQDCGEVLGTSYKLQTHQLKEHHKGKLFICKHCMFRSPRKKDLQAHCLSQHDELPSGVRIYVCSRCQYKCIDKYRFEEHEAMHSGVQKFKCSLCDKAYTTRRGLKTHLKYHSANKPFKCTMCTAEFKVKSKLSDHMKLIHLQKGFKPYKCSYCDHFTALRGNCNQHIKKSHPGLPIKVVDTAPDRKKTTANYDYANLEASDIDELEETDSNIKKSYH